MWKKNKPELTKTRNGPVHLFIVDDDPRICKMLKRFLEREGYRISTAADGAEMWLHFNNGEQPDAVILDIMLPGVDGITLARDLRAKNTEIGIIMLTAKDDPIDTIVGLEVGADDYVTKPFDNKQLLARIRSLLRRLSNVHDNGKNHDRRIVRFEGWQLDLSAYELVSPAGEKIRLTTQEFRLLEIFVRNPGHVLSRDKIMQSLSKQEWLPDNRSIDVMIGRLRKRIENDTSEPRFIRTIRNMGYQFTATVSAA